MSSTRKMFVPLAAAVAIAAAAAGCSSSGSDTGSTKAAESGTAAKPSEQAAAPLAPVTIKVLDSGGGYFGEADFKILLADPVKKKYPHITVERIAGKMQDMLTTGEAFDFFATWNGEIPTYKDAGIYTDITPMAQKSKFDLSRFNQAALDSLRIYGDKGELFAVPYAENIGALYYNKDLFDKFGVGYPGDGMSWEDAVNLGKRMTRQEGGVQYQGIFSQIGSLFSQLSLQFVESGTNKVLVADELYKRAFETSQAIFTIPGNAYRTGNGVDPFSKDRTLAMLSQGNYLLQFRTIPNFNWDVAQRPSYKEKPNISAWYNLHLIAPMKKSKYPDDQMRVLEVLFSDEVQSVMVKKTLRKSPLKDPKYLQQYGGDYVELQGKRLQSIFKSGFGPAPKLSPHYSKASSLATTEAENVIKGQKDINTALRDLEEKIKAYIAANPQ